MEGNQASPEPPFLLSSSSSSPALPAVPLWEPFDSATGEVGGAAEVRLRLMRTVTGNCKMSISIAVPRGHTDESLMIREDTYVGALDGRAESVARLLGVGGLGRREVLGHGLNGHGSRRTVESDGGNTGHLHLVPLPEPEVVSVCSRKRCCGVGWRGENCVRPQSLHQHQPSLTATTAHLPVKPAKHAEAVGGDGGMLRGYLFV
jgi:hypothetical protein